MRKKLLLLSTITLAGMLLVIGCGKSEKQSNKSNQTSDSTEKTESNNSIEVEKDLFDVTITIPADFVGEMTQEDLDLKVSENGYQTGVLNADGSVTYVMTKSQHKKMIESCRQDINDSLSEMIESQDYSFTNIETNDDFTSFTITTTSTELDLAESFSVMSFYILGGIYNAFNGTTVDNIHVEFVNQDSGEIIHSADSKNMNESN